jgi:uncharacterized protein (TIGR00255 family)
MNSMTGFARGSFHLRNFSLFVSFKSYNNRYLEISFKGSGVSAPAEKNIKEMMREKLQRGQIEVAVDLFRQSPGQWDINLNTSLIAEIMKQLAPLQKKFGLSLTLDSLLKLPMILHLDLDPERLSQKDQMAIRRSVAKVFAAFLESRAQEGNCIQRDLLTSIKRIEVLIKGIHVREKEFERDAFRNYRKKIEKFLKDLPIDEKRIALEAAISADKTSITEEINRLKTHTQRLKSLLRDASIASQGREADFLSQEMLRETHTIAAKTGSLDIHQQILLIRREIEKIREQVQNIE